MIAYKSTRPDGTDFRTGTVRYEVGATVSVDNPDPASVGACGVGLHVSTTARATLQYSNRGYRPWRWFEVEIDEADVIARDETKLRVSKLRVVRELSFKDAFGADFDVDACRAEVATWALIQRAARRRIDRLNRFAVKERLRAAREAVIDAAMAWWRAKSAGIGSSECLAFDAACSALDDLEKKP